MLPCVICCVTFFERLVFSAGQASGETGVSTLARKPSLSLSWKFCIGSTSGGTSRQKGIELSERQHRVACRLQHASFTKIPLQGSSGIPDVYPEGCASRSQPGLRVGGPNLWTGMGESVGMSGAAHASRGIVLLRLALA